MQSGSLDPGAELRCRHANMPSCDKGARTETANGLAPVARQTQVAMANHDNLMGIVERRFAPLCVRRGAMVMKKLVLTASIVATTAGAAAAADLPRKAP